MGKFNHSSHPFFTIIPNIGILVCVSNIKTGKSDFYRYTPEWICKNVKDWMKNNYPKESKIIIADYENK